MCGRWESFFNSLYEYSKELLKPYDMLGGLVADDSRALSFVSLPAREGEEPRVRER